MFVSPRRWRWWVINSQSTVIGLRLPVWPANACYCYKEFIVNVKIVEFATNHTL